MKIGILQCGHPPAQIEAREGNYAAMFRRILAGHGFDFADWDAENMDFPPGPDACDGWLLTGSRHGVYDDVPFIAPLTAFVRRAYAERVPVVGVCFGHQLLAQAMGGRVEKFAGGWAIGRQDYDFEGRRIVLNAWHQDQVTVPPPGARTIATSPFCRYAGLAYGDEVLSVQAHPEFTDAVMRDLIRLRRGTGSYSDAQMDAAADHLGGATDGDEIAGRIAAFFLAHAGAARPAEAVHG